jgi:hypothetical protein
LEGIDNKYIGRAIDDLVEFFGIREDIPLEDLLHFVRNGDTKKSVERIANHMGLPITVSLVIGDAFESRDLVTTDESGEGSEGITAQVSIPSYLPLYGSPELQGFPIQIKVSGDCKRYADTFVATIAHELSHIVLRSLWHTEKNNEIYTDLTAMVLGFAMAMRRGRYTVETSNIGLGLQQTRTTRFGYLKDEQFGFALNRINGILKTSRAAFKKMRTAIGQILATYAKQLDSYRKMVEEFNKLIEYLDGHRGKRIRQEDAAKIVEIHSISYGDRLLSVLRTNEKKLRETQSLCSGWFEQPENHYSRQKLNSLVEFHNNLDSLVSGLGEENATLKDDVAVMRRCLTFFERLQAKR